MVIEVNLEQLRRDWGLVVDRLSFERACTVSEFFVQRLKSWLNHFKTLDDYSQALILNWSPLWSVDVSQPWLQNQVSSVFLNLDSDDPNALAMTRLRLLRNMFQVRAIYRECYSVGRSSHLFIQQMSEYSEFATLVIDMTERYLRHQLSQQWQLKSQPGPILTFALGKLGAGELNLSSDVDLIFCFHHAIKIDHPDRTNSEFYTRLAQRMIRFLNDITPAGFVFRIDMRLRPFGQSGALVWSAQALETYYEQQGRMWERYAWIKTKVITGGSQADAVLDNLRPFVYRRYVDFGVIQALREMKGLIEREVNRKDAQDNIKIGRGGIREVEFIIQVIQLIRGGEFPEIRQASLMQAMACIETLDLLPVSVLHELRADYLFLRQVEHFLQAFADRQTQCLPTSPTQWQALLAAFGVTDQEHFVQQLQAAQDRIHYHFQQTIRPPKPEQIIPKTENNWANIWPDQLHTVNHAELRQQLEVFKKSRCVERASDIGCTRLNTLMPTMLAMLETLSDEKSMPTEATLSHQLQCSLPELEMYWAGQSETLRRLLLILEAIMRRSTYLSLLTENPKALFKVVKVCGTSALLATKLARYPSLLDEFIDDQPVFKPPTRNELLDELRQQLIRIPEDDFEQQMARLRAFKQRHTVRAAVADIQGHLPLMNVSDYLTWLAEALLQAALDIAWHKLIQRYGTPELHPGASTGFVIVAYGKLGGIELSYTSDLDIVFLYDTPADGETDGLKTIDNSVFYVQLVKNLNHILMTTTLDGRLYDIDMRLRPSGNKGLFVSTIEGFERYQNQDAWVWEQQALVRARPVAGDSHLFGRFNELRQSVLLSLQRTPLLADRVVEMREKMRNHLKSKTTLFDLKYGIGGLVYIEFLAQHLVLSYSAEQLQMARYSDNVRIFESAIQYKVLLEADARTLIHAYLLYRALIHRLSLQGKPILIDQHLLVDTREQVQRISDEWFAKQKE